MGFSIKELEALSGVKAHTIRIWEQRYNFLKPLRTSTNIRSYTNDELKTILTVALLNKHGYKISRIDAMQEDQRFKEVLELTSTEAKKEQLVNELIGKMIDMEANEFEKLLDQHIAENGFYATITEVVFFFLEKIGILWQTGKIKPAHEHIVSNIIRQKIVAAIEEEPVSEKKEPLFLLLLPEDEHHELGLLFVYYLLRKNELPVIYLGSSVPVKDAIYLINHKQPAYIYIHLSSIHSKKRFSQYVDYLINVNSSNKILISGSVIDYIKTESPKLLKFSSLQQIFSYITSLTVEVV